jgi:hypothetical protein
MQTQPGGPDRAFSGSGLGSAARRRERLRSSPERRARRSDRNDLGTLPRHNEHVVTARLQFEVATMRWLIQSIGVAG